MPRFFAPLCVLLIVLGSAMGAARAEVQLNVGPGELYTSVQTAVNAVPASGAERYVINIAPGVYTERVFVVPDKVTLRGTGASPEDTKLTYFETASTPPNESTVHASTVIRGKDFIAENLTFENSAGQNAGQALAIYVRGDRATFNKCRFLGWQDTLRSESGRHYFYDSYIEGSVDFIYGKGQAYFEKSTLYAKAGGYLTAQGREGAAESNGYVFKDSTIMGSAPNSSVYLGRPWQAYSRAVFIDTKMSPIINSAGWSTWSGNNHLTAFFAEYNSMDLAGDPINVSRRVSWSHQLTAGQLDPFSKENWLAGTDGWNPVIAADPLLPGDYNNDGQVDAADYSVWRNALTTGDPLLNESASPGAVDQLDYDVWRQQYGQSLESPPSTDAAPEPSSATIALLLGTLTWRRKRAANSP